MSIRINYCYISGCFVVKAVYSSKDKKVVYVKNFMSLVAPSFLVLDLNFREPGVVKLTCYLKVSYAVKWSMVRLLKCDLICKNPT